MNTIIARYRNVIVSLMVLIAVSLNSQEPKACKPCAAAAAARLSAAAAAAASLATGKPTSREMELDSIDLRNTVVEACCEYCAMPNSLGCQGPNSVRCNTCQAGLVKISVAEAAAAALAAVGAVVNKRKELDELSSSTRAPREELVDPCDCVGSRDVEPADEGCPGCSLDCKLQALFDCCVNTNMQVRCQGVLAEKCCRRIKHKLNDLEDDQEDVIESLSVVEGLMVSQIDASAGCCSIIDARIGDLAGSAFDIPDTDNIVSFVDTMDADIITWLKSLYVLAYNVYQCTCLD